MLMLVRNGAALLRKQTSYQRCAPGGRVAAQTATRNCSGFLIL